MSNYYDKNKNLKKFRKVSQVFYSHWLIMNYHNCYLVNTFMGSRIDFNRCYENQMSIHARNKVILTK